jgi:hypothetical protein
VAELQDFFPDFPQQQVIAALDRADGNVQRAGYFLSTETPDAAPPATAPSVSPVGTINEWPEPSLVSEPERYPPLAREDYRRIGERLKRSPALFNQVVAWMRQSGLTAKADAIYSNAAVIKSCFGVFTD